MKISKGMFNTEKRPDGIRINKYLADAGVCSRREADEAVEKGKVKIDGETAVIGSRVLKGQKVEYNNKEIDEQRELILIAFNKPAGIVCTTDRRDPDNIIDYINYGKRIFPIGRLDKESEGLILLTNDGDIVNKILRAGNYHEKEYIVKVNKELTSEFLTAMASGVEILDTVTRPCKIEQIDKTTFKIILTQGLNRQIRRMCEALDYRVRGLERVRIMNILLGRLKTGDYRKLYEGELTELNKLISCSSNAPISKEFPSVKPEVIIKTCEKKRWFDKKKADSIINGKDKTESKKGDKGYKERKQDNNREEGKSYQSKAGDRRNDEFKYKSGAVLSEYKRKTNKTPGTDRTSWKGSKSVRAGRP